LNIFNFKAISTKHLFTNKKIAVVSVINDLVTDVRVNKTVQALLESNYEVVLIGRQLPNSKPFEPTDYRAIRLNMLFKKGPLFYLFFNLRLFFKLLFLKADLLYANDLDTLLPNFLISKSKNIPLIYDSHELFCEVPELQKTPFKKAIWLKLESAILPKLKHCITVSNGIAEYYNQKYNCHFEVIRNIPPTLSSPQAFKNKQQLGIDPTKKMILLQGAGINVDRGAEELVEAMQYVKDVVLYIIGSGDVWDVLQQMVNNLSLQNKVIMINKLPKNELIHYTANADIGLSIDKNTNLNYYYSLPNKLFDYIALQIPILSSRLYEIEKIINTYHIGEFIDNHQVQHIAERLNEILNGGNLVLYKQNAVKAMQDLNWENEKQSLLKIIKNASGH